MSQVMAGPPPKYSSADDEHEILPLERGRSPIYNWVESWAIISISFSLSFFLCLAPPSSPCLSLLLFRVFLFLPTVKRRSRSRLLSGIKIPKYRENECRLERNHTPDAVCNPAGSLKIQARNEQSASSGKSHLHIS